MCCSSVHYTTVHFYTYKEVRNKIFYKKNLLPAAETPPGYADRSFSDIIYRTNRPVQNLSAAENLDFDNRVIDGRNEPYWTPEKKQRVLYIAGLALSILTAPLLFPLIPAFFCGRALKRSFQKGDLDCQTDRVKIRERIAGNELTLFQIAKRYGFENVKKYRLLDNIPTIASNEGQNTDERIQRNAYERFRQLDENYQETKNTHNFHKKQIKKIWKNAVGNVVSAYRLHVTLIVVKQALFCIGHILLAALSAANNQSKSDRNIGAKVGLTINHGVETLKDMGELSRISDEYATKVHPWNDWKDHRMNTLKGVYTTAKNNLQRFFEEFKVTPVNIDRGSSVLAADGPALIGTPSAPPLNILPSAPPLEDFLPSAPPKRKLFSPVFEKIGDKIYPCCPITYEPMTKESALSLSCGHVFSTAIKDWLGVEKKHSCPTCRAPAKPTDLEPVSESDLLAPESAF